MRIALLRKQQPFAEFDQRTMKWRIWYIFNNDVTSGTYYELSFDGTCDRVTVVDNDVVSIDRVVTGAVDYPYTQTVGTVTVSKEYEAHLNNQAKEHDWLMKQCF